MSVCTVIAGGVGLPVGGAEMSGFGGLDYDVLNVSPCEKRTKRRRESTHARNTPSHFARSRNFKDDRLGMKSNLIGKLSDLLRGNAHLNTTRVANLHTRADKRGSSDDRNQSQSKKERQNERG